MGVMMATAVVLEIAHTLEVLVWAATYGIVHAAAAGSDLLYFAFVNYTTLGYGDITPVQEWRLIGPLTAMRSSAISCGPRGWRRRPTVTNGCGRSTVCSAVIRRRVRNARADAVLLRCERKAPPVRMHGTVDLDQWSKRRRTHDPASPSPQELGETYVQRAQGRAEAH